MITNAFGSDENGQLNGFPNIPNKIFIEEVPALILSFPELFLSFSPLYCFDLILL